MWEFLGYNKDPFFIEMCWRDYDLWVGTVKLIYEPIEDEL